MRSSYNLLFDDIPVYKRDAPEKEMTQIIFPTKIGAV
jgi:hypothetical protein